VDAPRGERRGREPDEEESGAHRRRAASV